MATISSRDIASGIKFVDISDKPVEAEVIRNGVKVGRVDIRQDLVADFIAPDRLDTRLAQPRVIFQSVPRDKRVARGTVVDVVLSSPHLIGANFVAGSHTGLAGRSLGDVGDLFLANAAVEDAVRKATTPDELNAEVRGSIEATAVQNNIAVSPTAPQQDFNALFAAIKAAQTFK
jgi:hypothetical protein